MQNVEGYASTVVSHLAYGAVVTGMKSKKFTTIALGQSKSIENSMENSNNKLHAKDISTERRSQCMSLGTPYQYHISRVLLLKGMSLIYLLAFLTSAAQNKALFGDYGFHPISILYTTIAVRQMLTSQLLSSISFMN